MPDLFGTDPQDPSVSPTPVSTDPQATPQPDVVTPTNLFTDQLSMITNEEGNQKYNSVEDALKALAHSQQHIANLEAEKGANDAKLASVQAQLDKLGDIDTLVERLKPQAPVPDPVVPAANGLTEEKVLELLHGQQAKSQAEQVAATNVQTVHTALVNSYGEKAQEMVVAKAASLNMTPADLGKLSEQNPSLVLELFGKQAQTPVQPTTPNLNIPPITPTSERLGKPEKSLLSGATSKEQTEFMRKIRAEVYKDNDVEV